MLDLKIFTPLLNKLLVLNGGNEIKPLNKYGEFSKRIKLRHDTFWKSRDAESVRNMFTSVNDPIAKWKDSAHWQRKLSNKNNSMKFAKFLGCRVPALYWKGRNIEEIDFNALPEYYVIKPTIGHSCQSVFLMAKSVNLMNMKTYTEKDILKLLSKALEKNKHLEFLIQEFVTTENKDYEIPVDYKFYTFNGEIALIEVINRLSPTKGTSSYYDEYWNMMRNLTVGKYIKSNYQEPPKCLNEMITCAKRLSKTYEIFVRIDFYASDKGAVFGEFTPTPGSASWLTKDADQMFTDYWNRFCRNLI